MHLKHRKKETTGGRPPDTPEKKTNAPLTVEQRVDEVLRTTSPPDTHSTPSPHKSFFIRKKYATPVADAHATPTTTTPQSQTRHLLTRPHFRETKAHAPSHRRFTLHRQSHQPDQQPAPKPKKHHLLHLPARHADKQATSKPKKHRLLHRRPHLKPSHPPAKKHGLLHRTPTTTPETAKKHTRFTRKHPTTKHAPKIKKHPAFTSHDTLTAPGTPQPDQPVPPSPTTEGPLPEHKTRFFFAKNKQTKPKKPQTSTTAETPKTRTKPKPTTTTQPISTPQDTETRQEEPKFPEYLPNVNDDEASTIDQKIKETLTATSDIAFLHDPAHPHAAHTPAASPQTPTSPSAATPNQPEAPIKISTKERPTKRFEDLAPDGILQNQDIARQLKDQTLGQLGYKTGTIEEIDFYPLYEPYAYVEIVREQDSLDKRYLLVEIQLTPDENNLLNFLKTTFSTIVFHPHEIDEVSEFDYLTTKVDEILDDYMVPIENETKKKLIYFLEKEFLGLGKLEILMKDPNIEDISCDGVGIPIFLYHRRYGSLQSNVEFTEEEQLSAFVVKLAQKCGKHISVAEPMLDATMPDGSRIQMTLSTEVTTKGSTFTIRKFSEDPFSPPDLVEFHTMSSEMVAFMWLAIENGINALIAGGTAAGKTSTLNALSLFIPRESKIVSIEETREINLPHPNWIPGVVRSGFGEVVGNKVIGEIDLYDLMKAALRQRPEYIIVGEIRGKEAYVLFQAMATGHTTYSTVHADSAQSLIHRLEGKPIEIPRIMLQALDLICIQVISRVKNKRARRCKQIIEIIDIDPTTKEILTNEVFHWDPIEDKFIYSGKSYVLERIRSEKDISREEMIQEIKNRSLLIEWMNKENYREFKKVATIIAQYADNPAETMKKVLGQP